MSAPWTVIGTRCDTSGVVYGAVLLLGHVEYEYMTHSDETHQFVHHVWADTPVAALEQVGA